MSVAADSHASIAVAGKNEEKLLNLFFILYKNARIVDCSNPAFQRQCGTFFELLQVMFEETNETTIKNIAGRFFVNHKLTHFGEQTKASVVEIIAEWEAIGLAGVKILPDITLEEILEFYKFVSGIKPTADNIEQLAEAIKKHRQPNIRFLSAKEVAEDTSSLSEDDRKQLRANARSMFFRAMSIVEENMVNLSQGMDVDISKTKRVVRSLIDHISKDEQSLLELASIKNFDDYTYAHSTNVCVYALTLGVRLGLDRARLSQLGFAALFHDVGKVRLPLDLIKKPTSYDENDWVQMQKHPQLGAKTILRNIKFDTYTARAARAIFEHHINADFTGYPLLRLSKRPLNLFSKIISIVDTFDALTSGRIYIRKPTPPDITLQKMFYQMKVKFDPFLLKIFNDIIGIYPAGTLVLLNTEELALVLTNNETNKARPYIKIVGNRDGLLEVPEWVDLTLPEQSHRKIIRRVDPARYGLDIRDFILSD